MTNEIIRKRKSIRKYEREPLDGGALAAVREKLAALTPLFPGIRYAVETAGKTGGLFGIEAPHYLIFTGEKADGRYENIGFVGQQMDLFFSENGIGCCWLGMAKPENAGKTALPFAISMAFGKPAEPLYRDLSEFRRKPLSEISTGTDSRLEAARLAPSGMNVQGWFFAAEDGKIRCYRKKPFPLPERLGRIDMGIALCHIASESERFRFRQETDVPRHAGYLYAGTVVSE